MPASTEPHVSVTLAEIARIARDTRTVLGLCLSAIHTAPVEGARGFGVFRM
ncbi:hypothetical protein [Streptomyces sp. NPDC048845]|uniref:hypothetical protein n=1 Tax=Streptomyces sp. NPDC048845 TaxID=3155390 RepID=UPI003444AC89